MKQKLTRGFTLIELLVVIAIIGILASVVLASLNTARDKGADAAAKSSLNNTRAQAEIVYDNASGSYAAVCADTVVTNAVAAATNATGNTAVCSNDTSGTGWAANVGLKGGGFYCVDSTGNSTTTGASTIVANSDWTC